MTLLYHDSYGYEVTILELIEPPLPPFITLDYAYFVSSENIFLTIKCPYDNVNLLHKIVNALHSIVPMLLWDEYPCTLTICFVLNIKMLCWYVSFVYILNIFYYIYNTKYDYTCPLRGQAHLLDFIMKILLSTNSLFWNAMQLGVQII